MNIENRVIIVYNTLVDSNVLMAWVGTDDGLGHSTRAREERLMELAFSIVALEQSTAPLAVPTA